MKLLFQLGAFCLLLASLAVPVAEFFDRWDTGGISNDSELAVFGLVLSLTLLLLVSKLVSGAALVVSWIRFAGASPRTARLPRPAVDVLSIAVCAPPGALPLRI